LNPHFSAIDPEFLAGIAARTKAGEFGAPIDSSVPDRITRRFAVQNAEANLAKRNLKAREDSAIKASDVYGSEPDGLRILEESSVVLGRPATPLDVLDMVESGDTAELAARFAPEGSEVDDDQKLPRGYVFAYLLSGVLHGRGYARRDIYHEWIFAGPDGDTIDVAQVVEEALASSRGMSRLRALFS
jgi:hypothetical protein